MTEPRYEQYLTPGSAAAQGPGASVTVNHYQGPPGPGIEALPAPSAPATDWLMAQPSRLLDARSRVVPFIGREAELERLRRWRDTRNARLSVLLLHAPGGEGKTRLAMEFAERSRDPGRPAAERWQVLHAVVREGGPARGTGTQPAEDGAGVLLVVDYADRWAYSQLERLLSDPVLHRQRPTRVLLIGRTVRWFAALRGELHDRRAEIDDMLLPSLDADRLRMFTAARDRYGASDLYDLPNTSAVEPPALMDRPDFGLTLTLQMAALVAVDAHARGRRPSLTEPHELSAYLLDREYRAWQRLFEAGGSGLDYKTRPAVMARTVFTAALTGAVSHGTGARALRALDMPGHPQDLLLDHRFCYPPVDRDLFLEPLYPDRLTEDFLGLFTPGHDITAYDPDPWAGDVPAALMGGDLGPAVAPRAVTFLASAAARWAHVGRRVLYPLLRSSPHLAITAGSPALTTLAALAGLGDAGGEGDAGGAGTGDEAALPLDADLVAVLEAVEAVLPSGRHVELDNGILAVAEALTAHRLATTEDPARRAVLYGTLAWRRANAGRREQAVFPAEEAVRLHRELAAEDPAHLPFLANSLGVLGERLSAAGRWEEALFTAEESVAIGRRLTAVDPAAHQDRLAGALTGLGSSLSRHGRRAEALAVTEEAAELYRRLSESDPVYRPDRAALLTHLGLRLLDAGRTEEGLAASEEAAGLYRRLSAADPGSERHHFARSLINLGAALRAVGRLEEGLEVTEVAGDLYRRLAEANPAAHQPDLTAALVSLGAFLAEMGRGAEGLAPVEEAVEIQRRLAESDPAAHSLDLARVLNDLGTRLLALGHEERALAVTREADDLYRRLARAHPTVDLPEHAAVQDRLAREPDRVREEALAVTREATELYRLLANPPTGADLTDLSTLAGALGRVGETLIGLGRFEEALTAVERAAAVHLDIGDRRRAAELLLQSGSALAGIRRQKEAIGLFEQAVQHFDRLGERALLGATLTNLGTSLAADGRTDEAVTACERAAAIFRSGGPGGGSAGGDAASDPGPLEIAALTNLSNALTAAKRYAEAAEVSRRAAALSAGGGRDRFGSAPLHNLGNALINDGRFEEAIAPVRQAAALYRQDGDRGREADSLANLAVALHRTGRLDEAITTYQRSAALFEETGERGKECWVLGGLIPALIEAQRYEAAVDAAQRSATLYRDLGDRTGEASALINLGNAAGQGAVTRRRPPPAGRRPPCCGRPATTSARAMRCPTAARHWPGRNATTRLPPPAKRPWPRTAGPAIGRGRP